jgi:mannose/fructose-specific phosphotransferase system component IIA
MSEPLRGVVVTHDGLAEALVRTVVLITGDDGGLTPLTNDGATREALCADVGGAIGDAPAVIFVDLPGGSCLHAVVTQVRDRADVAVVAGVNLPMLLDFVYHRDLAPPEAAERAVRQGGAAIRQLP